MIEHVLDLGNQLKKELETSTDFLIDSYNDLLIVGMGGSGVAGDVLKLVLNETTQINVEVRKAYGIPEVIVERRPKCLFISYSGNTEETLSYYDYAVRLTDHALVVTTGGELLKKAKSDNIKFHLLPKGYPPRSALGFALTFLISLFDKEGVSNIDFECLESFAEESSTKILKYML